MISDIMPRIIFVCENAVGLYDVINMHMGKMKKNWLEMEEIRK